MRKIARQPRGSVRAPPIKGPIAMILRSSRASSETLGKGRCVDTGVPAVRRSADGLAAHSASRWEGSTCTAASTRGTNQSSRCLTAS